MAFGNPPTFRVVNFKSISSVVLEPSRVTVLAGSNSSGKSSLLQAALFFAQSQAAGSIVINGELVRLGEPIDVIRDGTDFVAFEFSVPEEFNQGEQPTVMDVVYRVELTESGGELRAASASLRVDDATLIAASEPKAGARMPPVFRGEVRLAVENPAELALPDASYLILAGCEPIRLVYEADHVELRKEFVSILGSPRADFTLLRLRPYAARRQLSDEISEILRGGRPEIRAGLERGLSEEQIDELFRIYMDLVAPGGWVSERIAESESSRSRFDRMSTERPEGPEKVPGWIASTVFLRDMSESMSAFATSIVYLGPLRDDPRVAYPLGHTVENLPVGEKGEFTAAYLEQNRGGRIFRYRNRDGEMVWGTLQKAVVEWCDYLGIATGVRASSGGKLGHRLALKIDGRDRDPTAVGVGASQLLPVIVLVLGAEPGELVLLEQPELHLNPKVQSRLADFFAWAREDVKLLVETHSENIVTRLRLRVAEQRLAPEDVVVKFVERVTERRATEEVEEGVESEPIAFSRYQSLTMDEMGDFDLWPTDFFDSLSADNILIAQQIASRLRERLNRKDDE